MYSLGKLKSFSVGYLVQARMICLVHKIVYTQHIVLSFCVYNLTHFDDSRLSLLC